MAKEKKRKLTGKEQAFVDYYFVHKFNAYQAAVAAGYSEKTAYQIASQNLRKLHIQEAIQARLAEVHMSADEALTLLALQARGDIGEIMETTSFGYNFDLAKAKEIGFTKLIKKIKQKTVTIMGKGEDAEDTEIHTTEIEIHDSQSALDKILRVHGRYNDQIEHVGEVELIVKYATDNKPSKPPR